MASEFAFPKNRQHTLGEPFAWAGSVGNRQEEEQEQQEEQQDTFGAHQPRCP